MIETYSKPPPNSTELEASILAACLMGDAAEICDLVCPDDFYKTAHRKIFESIQKLVLDETDITLVSVTELLRERQQLEASGGAVYVANILDCPLATDLKYSCRKLRDLTVRRNLIIKSHEIINKCFNSDDFDSLIDFSQKAIIDTTEQANRADEIGVTMSKLVEDAADDYEYIYKNPGITGISTDIGLLDDMTCGLQKSDLIILAGRPSMGKTAFALNLVHTISLKNKIPSGFISLEMAKAQLRDRLIAIDSGVNLLKFRSGRFDSEDWARITLAQGRYFESNIIINDTAYTPLEIRRAAMGMLRKHNIQILFIDYLQLAKLPKGERRDLEVGELSRSLKLLAKELNIPIVALSQLNRQLEQRGDKRPLLSDLRESGSLEQDADIVAFIYRDEVYNNAENNPKKGTAELLIRKQRNGPTGDIMLKWHDKTTRFYDLTNRQE